MLTTSGIESEVRPSRLPRLLEGLLPGQVGEVSRGAAPLLLALSALNASNYLFHVVISRLLGPVDYGALTALLALMLVLSVPFGVLQTTVAKRTSAIGAGGSTTDLCAGTMRLVLPVACASCAIFVVFAPAVAAFLHVGVVSAGLVGPYVMVSLLLSVPLGVLQGRLRFTSLAAATLSGVGARFVLGVGLVSLGLGVPAALIASVIAQLVALGVALAALRLGPATWRASRSHAELLRGEFVLTLLGVGVFWMLAEGDVVLARHFLGTVDAGYYSSAEVMARALLFLPGAISMAALPRFVRLRGRGAELLPLLRSSLGMIMALEAASLTVLVLVRHQAVAVAFGSRFAPAARLLPLLAIGTGLMAAVLLLTYFHVAVGTRSHLILLGGLTLQSGLIVAFHDEPIHIAMIVVLAAALTALVMYRAAVTACRWSPPLDDTGIGPRTRAERRLSVVLPCHNAGNGLSDVLTGLQRELHDVDSEIIVVSDGSTDSTAAVARSFGVRVIEYDECGGKGYALRVGLSEARGEYIAFMDSDGDIDPAAVRPFLTIMELYAPDIVLGSKRHPLSEVDYPPLRRVLSWTYHKLTRVLFRVNVRDTQTGMKLLRRDMLAAVLPRMLEKRYAFDLELLVVADRLGYRRVFEAPIRIDYRFQSQVDPRAATRIAADTFGIFYRRYVLNTYGRQSRRLRDTGGRLAIRTGGRPSDVQIETAPDVASPACLRILIINWRDIRNPDAGGAEVFTHEVASRWAAWGHEVWLLTSRFPGARAVETIDGVRVRRIGRLRNGSFHLLVQRELARLEGFDAVIDEVNTIPFFTPLWRSTLPPTLTLVHQLAQDVWDAELPKPLAALGRRVEPAILRLYRDVPVVTVSESTRRDLVRLGLRDVSTVRQGRDAPPDDVRDARERRSTFLFVGRLAPNKRPDHAIEAFRTIRESLPDAQLWVVGRGPMEDALRSSLPPGIEMLGHLPRTELYERMARAHALLVPSVREGWGMVITEANGVGTPAIGYDVPGIRDAIRHRETGLIVPAGDREALALAAVELATNAEMAASMRRHARSWAAGFSWDATAEQLFELVEACVGARLLDDRGLTVPAPREEAPRELSAVG